ncbi:hypothetical protein [Mycolicibacterium fortuitum]|uniref:hypothetical protein n=1 Tax=Mycolicibacterium fortuitum TaxID=1766 RepID=UPI000D6CA4DE|nr:hypothetical protein [Mycolicibacterium fortuitum]
MAAYRMTPARRAALEKAQEASARKRRKAHNRRRNVRIAIGVTGAATAGVAGGFAVHRLSLYRAEQELVSDPVNKIIIERHIELARFHNDRLNQLRGFGFPIRKFSEEAARLEAIRILSKRKKKRT